MITVDEWRQERGIIFGQRVHVRIGVEGQVYLADGIVNAILDHPEGPEILVSFFHPLRHERFTSWIEPRF